jgi:hypothetical protein
MTLADLCDEQCPSAWPVVDGRSAPDSSFAAFEHGVLAARCSAWWTETPALAGERVGVIGHFAATGESAARDVLDAACCELCDAGATIVLGPMDGNTWRRYRLVTGGDTSPPFFLEPTNPPAWPHWFASAGWRVHARYHSAVNERLELVDPSVPAKSRALAERGVSIRDMEPERMRCELRAIHGVASVAFAGSPLYTPLAEEAFLGLYEPIVPFVDPRLVSIAEHDGRPVGFCFCVPNASETRDAGRPGSVVLKTFAVLPGYTGLGSVLAARTNSAARALGYSRVIHALMHEENDRSRALSSRQGRGIRQYALFERRLHSC